MYNMSKIVVIYDWKVYNLQVKLQTKNQDRSGE